MAARPQILIAEPDDFTPGAIEILREAGDVEVLELPRGEMARALASYDAVWFRLAHRVDAAALSGDVRCRVLACAVTGLDHLDLAACDARGVRVISLRGEREFLRRVRATAELTIGLALALIRKIPQARASVLDGVWDRDLFRGRELFERTAGVVGVGRLGSITAEYFSALGMRVIGFDPRAESMPSGVERAASLHELLAAADLVSLHVSYDASTHGLIGARELAAMKPTSILINTSRGGVVDTGALLAALSAGRLAGAALDVLDGEPAIGPDHPAVRYARENDHLLIVPHIGGNTFESIEKCELFIAAKVVEALQGWVPRV